MKRIIYGKISFMALACLLVMRYTGAPGTLLYDTRPEGSPGSDLPFVQNHFNDTAWQQVAIALKYIAV